MFWFSKKPTIVLECFTYEKHVAEEYPIIEAAKTVPEWFSNMKGDYLFNGFIPRATVKKCPAIVRNITSGIILPIWSDLALKNNTQTQEYFWAFSDGTNCEPHDREQWDAFKSPSESAHLKLLSPWRFKTKQDIKFLWQSPYYHKTNPLLEIVQGIDCYQHTHSTTINCFIDITKDYNTLIRAGSPLVHLIPLSDSHIKIKINVISKEEWLKLDTPKSTFLGRHKKAAKCPFHRK